MLDYKDGGYKSRKMVMAYVVMGLMTLGWAATVKWTALNVSFGEFCMGLLGAATIYVGSNSISKWVIAKNSKNTKKEEE